MKKIIILLLATIGMNILAAGVGAIPDEHTYGENLLELKRKAPIAYDDTLWGISDMVNSHNLRIPEELAKEEDSEADTREYDENNARFMKWFGFVPPLEHYGIAMEAEYLPREKNICRGGRIFAAEEGEVHIFVGTYDKMTKEKVNSLITKDLIGLMVIKSEYFNDCICAVFKYRLPERFHAEWQRYIREDK